MKRIIKTIFPYAILLRVKKVVYFGKQRYCPVCENSVRLFQPFGIVPRPDARCPVCGSLERHRLVWLFFRQRTDLFDPGDKKMFYVAPETHIERRLKEIPGLDCITADIAEDRAMMRVDITNISFADSTFDVIYCSHVLEHIQEDRQAMVELYRILKPGGWAVLQVSITSDVTIEDASVTDPGEREKLFGQADHVRRYGPDYKERLAQAGFRLRSSHALDIADTAECVKMGLMKDDEIFFCVKE